MDGLRTCDKPAQPVGASMNANGSGGIRRSDIARFTVAVLTFSAVASYAALAFIPTVAAPPPGGGWSKNIGAACMRMNATAYKCAVTSADSGVDFAQVGVQLVRSDGTILCWFAAGFVLGSVCQVSGPVGGGRHIDNGDSMFGAGDDFLFTPLYLPAGTSLSGTTFKLSGGGATGAAPLN